MGSQVHSTPANLATGVLPTAAPHAPKRLFVGRKLASSSRHLVDKHDLKKRPYISTTSMDAELALVTANVALAGPGKVFLDPFVGTGGFLVAAAELGALTLGSDIDGRSFRGKGQGMEEGVMANFRKYGIEDRFGDCIISDLTNSPFRIVESTETNLKLPSGTGGEISTLACPSIQTPGLNASVTAERWLDGIICDPPYGVREGLKVLGTRGNSSRSRKHEQSARGAAATPLHLVDGVPSYMLEGYIAPKKPYSFSRMLDDILTFAACALVDGGRLAFWMPTANEEGGDEELRIPAHRAMRLVHCCVQPFNKWSRRLLVYERKKGMEILDGSRPEQDKGREQMPNAAIGGVSADELNPFRRRYFQGFDASRANRDK